MYWRWHTVYPLAVPRVFARKFPPSVVVSLLHVMTGIRQIYHQCTDYTVRILVKWVILTASEVLRLMDDATYMMEAIRQANKAKAMNEVPIGAIIVHDET